jgi:cytochrome c-type biogenesis protein CcmH
MMTLWMGAAGLTVLALIFIFAPFFIKFRGNSIKRNDNNVAIYKSQLAELELDKQAGRVSNEDYQSQSLEVQRNLLNDTAQDNDSLDEGASGNWMMPVLAVIMIVGGVWIYQDLGAENEVAISELLKRSYQGNFEKEDSLELLERLNTQSLEKPADVETWYLLGRLNFELGNFHEAVLGFNGVLTNLPADAKEDQAVAMAQLAQAQFFASDRQLDKATESMLQQVLEINPQETTSLGLLGVASFDQQDFLAAVHYWQRLLAIIPANNPNAVAIKGGIEKARSQLSEAQLATLQAETKAVVATSIVVTVDLADNVKAVVPENADLFVLAKAKSGPPMPLAVKRLNVSQWPITVTLDDSMAMMESLKMSLFDEVVITARISKSGVGNAKPGDIEGTTGAIAITTKQTSVTINQVLP